MNVEKLVKMALEEDAVHDDLTCIATLAANQHGTALITAKTAGLLSGVKVAKKVFEQVDASIIQNWKFEDGDRVEAGDTVCELAGPMHALLAAERTALNFMQHLSGIATATGFFVNRLEGTGCSIVDTRKTTPGFRALEKQAVTHGGGMNHRMNLASLMLIKENHIEACGSITEAVGRCYAQNEDVLVEVECETFEQVEEAVHACPDMILLDNMTVEQVSHAREHIPNAILVEASGNITLENARSYAETGVNRIAIGAITHSAPALDLSMRVQATAVAVEPEKE